MMLRSVLILLTGLLLAGCQAADAVGTGADDEPREDAAAGLASTPEGDQTAAVPAASASDAASAKTFNQRILPVPDDQIPRTEEEWKQKLTPEQYHVLREHGTERPFTNEFHHVKGRAIFHCAGCGEPLFDSQQKFNSGCGWPSFTDVIGEVGDHIGTQIDRSLSMTRTEVHCQRCGGHLGHVFEDGPGPNGLRYCINAAALQPGAPPPADEAESQQAPAAAPDSE